MGERNIWFSNEDSNPGCRQNWSLFHGPPIHWIWNACEPQVPLEIIYKAYKTIFENIFKIHTMKRYIELKNVYVNIVLLLESSDVTSLARVKFVMFFFFFFFSIGFLRPDYYQTPTCSTVPWVKISLLIKDFCRLGTSCLPFERRRIFSCCFSLPHRKYICIRRLPVVVRKKVCFVDHRTNADRIERKVHCTV